MARELRETDEKRLEQYGVWVKVGPQEYSAASPETPFTLSDLESTTPMAEAETAPAPTADTTLTVEEEQLLDELETEVARSDVSAQGAPSVAAEEEIQNVAASEPVAFEEPLPSESDVFSAAAPPSAAQTSDVLSMDGGVESLPELELDDLDTPTSAPSVRAPSLPGEDDVVVLPEESTMRVSEELPEIGSEVPSEEPAQSEVEVTLSDNLPKEEHFDDLAALEEELNTVAAAPERVVEETQEWAEASRHAASRGPEDKAAAAEILSRIESELKSIRTDLTELKKELSGLRRGAEPGAAPKPPSEAGGFFDEEEDETIALTGDELDNILSTAEVTEVAEGAEEAAPDVGLPMEEQTEASEQIVPDLSGEPREDILSYDVPPASAPPAEAAATETEMAPLGEEMDTLTLGGNEELDQPHVGDELDLDDLGGAATQAAPGAEPSAEAEQLTDVELGDLGTAEETPQAEPLEEPLDLGVGGSEEPAAEETAELGPDLGLEDLVTPSAKEASPEEIDLESPLELETEPSAQSAETIALEPQAEPEEISLDEETPAASEEGTPEVIDLQALEAEKNAEEPQELGPTATPADLDLDELEAIGEEAEPAAPQEVQIPFESAAEGEAPAVEEVPAEAPQPEAPQRTSPNIPDDLKDEIRSVLKYMDQLLEALPEEKIQEFASSEYFVMYKKLFEDLGLGE